ncbi:hypothetical protein PG993_003121 [Apiospora rasikravindrae]|uniref:Heterokaryon incompatibility domain-containing protein n=1 Tax=Apiospora rasikravindrae TaxID=990691 RepID=A0ABR1TYK5_9PEZI
MTSMQRQEGNTYRSVKEPDYGILTYTWGRWPAPGGPHIAISGTTWTIPAVKESMFTVESFQNVIRKMGEAHDFAWIDVVCIDQENYDVKMDEIGRQVGIFNLAARVYLWLWTLPITRLQSACDEVDYSSGYIYTMDETDRDARTLLKSLDSSLETLLSDWWFTSLWTLQEGILRPDAILLSREAEHVRIRHSTPYTMMELRFVTNAFWNLRCALETDSLRPKDALLNDLGQAVVQRLKRAGYSSDPFSSNPNMQWGAARWRTASSEQDRVYGIQAIYNIRVGDTAPNAVRRQDRPLSELHMEFAATINAKSPLLGQMFVHSEPPPSGRTWQLSPNIRVPYEFCSYNDSSRGTCSITGNPAGDAQIEGQICFLNDIAQFWNAAVIHRTLGGVYLNVAVDRYIVQRHPAIYSVPEDLTARDNYITSSNVVNNSAILVDSVLKVFGAGSVSVLALGTITIDGDASHSFGLLLLHTPDDRTRTKRIGICRWFIPDPVQDEPSLFESVEWVQHRGSLG